MACQLQCCMVLLLLTLIATTHGDQVTIEDHAKWKYLVSADGCVAQVGAGCCCCGQDA